MDFKKTTNYIYKNCINRVKKRLEELGLPQISICPSDKSLVSHFFNYEKNYEKYKNSAKLYKKKSNPLKNNPYLITPKLLNGLDESGDACGIVPVLGFKDEYEVLWGTNKEFNNNLHQIFRNIISDLLDIHTYDKEINNALCDYVPFAKYSTYLQLIQKTHFPVLPYYGITEDEIFFNIGNAEANAIDFLYSKPDLKKDFNERFSNFIKKNELEKKYTNIDKKLTNKFVQPELIPLLEKYAPSGDSLGLRVKSIIEHDLSQSKDLILAHEENRTLSDSEYTKTLINASSSYVAKLEEIQKSFIYSH